MKKLSALLPLAIAAAFLPALSRADDARVPVNLHLTRSDLASEEAAQALYSRMMLRARNKCDPRREFVKDARDACAADLVGQWVEAIDDPRLAEIHERNS